MFIQTRFYSLLLLSLFVDMNAFMHLSSLPKYELSIENRAIRHSSLYANTDDKAAKEVGGEDLEIMLTEWETPMLVDAYATWLVFPVFQFSPISRYKLFLTNTNNNIKYY